MFPMSSPVPVPFELGHSTLSFERPRVMGIINATPDSFHTESRALKVEQALSMAERMMAQGADILDVGGSELSAGCSGHRLRGGMCKGVAHHQGIEESVAFSCPQRGHVSGACGHSGPG